MSRVNELMEQIVVTHTEERACFRSGPQLGTPGYAEWRSKWLNLQQKEQNLRQELSALIKEHCQWAVLWG